MNKKIKNKIKKLILEQKRPRGRQDFSGGQSRNISADIVKPGYEPTAGVGYEPVGPYQPEEADQEKDLPAVIIPNTVQPLNPAVWVQVGSPTPHGQGEVVYEVPFNYNSAECQYAIPEGEDLPEVPDKGEIPLEKVRINPETFQKIKNPNRTN